jgi:hypothetical protein
MFQFVQKENYSFHNIKFISAYQTLPRERKTKQVNQYILLQIRMSVKL